MNILEASDITKVFREGRESVPVLKGVSLTMGRGEVVALEGPSGSGKTTLLSILGCILTPTSGDVVVNGEKVDRDEKHLPAIRRKSIGFVFQQFNLFSSLTAKENVEYAINLKGCVGRKADNEARSLLDSVGLSDRMDFLPRDLSGGQKQRVAIARALGGNPPLLLADEPTANIDSATSVQILDLFKRLVKERLCSLLIVTHDPKVRTITDRVLSLRDGQIVTNP